MHANVTLRDRSEGRLAPTTSPVQVTDPKTGALRNPLKAPRRHDVQLQIPGPGVGDRPALRSLHLRPGAPQAPIRTDDLRVIHGNLEKPAILARHVVFRGGARAGLGDVQREIGADLAIVAVRRRVGAVVDVDRQRQPIRRSFDIATGGGCRTGAVPARPAVAHCARAVRHEDELERLRQLLGEGHGRVQEPLVVVDPGKSLTIVAWVVPFTGQLPVCCCPTVRSRVADRGATTDAPQIPCTSTCFLVSSAISRSGKSPVSCTSVCTKAAYWYTPRLKTSVSSSSRSASGSRRWGRSPDPGTPSNSGSPAFMR